MFERVTAVLVVLAFGLAGWATYRTALPSHVESNITGESIRQYIMANPEIVIEAAQAYERQRRQQDAASDITLIDENRAAIFSDGHSLVAGNPNGDVTLVEFADYNCPYCKRGHSELVKLIEDDPNVRIIKKEFPILGPGSVFASRAAIAARQQKSGQLAIPFNNALMKHQGRHSEQTVMAIALEVGLNVDDLRSDMDTSHVGEQIQITYALAQNLRINGTPAYIVDGRIVRGFVPAATLRDMIVAAREKDSEDAK